MLKIIPAEVLDLLNRWAEACCICGHPESEGRCPFCEVEGGE